MSLQNPGGVITITNGDELVVTQNGIDLEPLEGDPCHIIVTLAWIYYAGDNIGSTWQLEVTVDGEHWNSGKIDLAPRTFNRVGQKLFDQEYPAVCGKGTFLALSIVSRERSGRFDDVGKLIYGFPISCPREGSIRKDIIPVSVPETLYFPWYPLFGRWRRNAILYFYIVTRATCVG